MSIPGSPIPLLRNALASLAETSTRLSKLSRRSYQNPYTFEWPETVDPEKSWFSTPEYLSLYGTAAWYNLDQTARRRLSFYEAANFYSLNIHGEKALMQGLAARLYRRDLIDVVDYLHHFLDEENKHSVYFGGFCTRYAHVYRTRQLALNETRSPLDVEDFLFFAKTLIFEEIVDRYNWVQSRDSRLDTVARFINHYHHVEEARHLVFGRRLVATLWKTCSLDWDEQRITEIRGYLRQFLVASWREYYNPDVYADVGFKDPWRLAEQAWATREQRVHRRDVSAKCMEFLLTTGIFTEEPTDAF
jgi:hypothetical protein